MQVPSYRGEGDRIFYTIADTADRLAMTEDQVRGLIRKKKLTECPTSILVDPLPAVRGRPCTKVVPRNEVETLRRTILEKLGAVEPGTLSDPDSEVQERNTGLEQANSDLRGEVESLKEVVRLGFVADEAHLEQLRQVFAPSKPPVQGR